MSRGHSRRVAARVARRTDARRQRTTGTDAPQRLVPADQLQELARTFRDAQQTTGPAQAPAPTPTAATAGPQEHPPKPPKPPASPAAASPAGTGRTPSPSSPRRDQGLPEACACTPTRPCLLHYGRRPTTSRTLGPRRGVGTAGSQGRRF